MVIARKHGMFYQNRKNIRQHNNRINALPSVAGTSLRAAARNAARYAGVMFLNLSIAISAINRSVQLKIKGVVSK